MNTPEHDESRDYDRAEPAPAVQPQDTLVELGRISDTQGGLLGVKYDTGLGWQYA